MHHSKSVFSPAGTPLLDRTVGELVAERPGRSRAFQAHGIGFCCQGSLTLRGACERKGLDPEQVATEIEQEAVSPTGPSISLADLSLDELRARLVDVHHGFLRQELARLHAMSERVAQVHGGHTPSLVQLYHSFTEFANQLVLHVERTERELVPAVATMMESGSRPASLAQTLSELDEDHNAIGEAMQVIRTLTNDFDPPADACNTYRALFAGLNDLDADLQRHIHLENAVLFPQIRGSAAA